jgi:hypothetical protein
MHFAALIRRLCARFATLPSIRDLFCHAGYSIPKHGTSYRSVFPDGGKPTASVTNHLHICQVVCAKYRFYL